jgi:TetR/AcrR family transcriptional regulator, regulator of autoinduction and epiphytic fitness
VAQPRIDGRTARAQRTRAAIVDAHLALLAAGDLKPTGERIAEAAGVSLRTLWTNFKDMETLFAAAGARLIETQNAAHRPVSPALPLRQRVEAFCEQRARMLEIIAPAARASVTREPFSAQLRLNRRIQLERSRAELEDVFGAELDAAGPARDELVNALLAMTTFASWGMWRDHLDMDVASAQAAMTRSVAALFSVDG